LYGPGFRIEVVKVATPLALSVPVPMPSGPHLKLTVPVGATGPEVVTVAVKVMDWPWVEGLRLEVRVMVVGD